MRKDGRQPNELRPVKVIPYFLAHPPGSCLIEMGKTRVICSVMVEESVPSFLKNSGKGWLTAEYNMLPASSSQRIQRERQKIGGRTHEIQRLIGRSLRACLDLNKIGERSFMVDCDVIDADGGTRTAAITGSYIALALAIKSVAQKVPHITAALSTAVAAISVGIIDGVPCLDLPYVEDKDAEVDMNVVQTAEGKYVEVQGTAEGKTFSDDELKQLLTLANSGIAQLIKVQREIIETAKRP